MDPGAARTVQAASCTWTTSITPGTRSAGWTRHITALSRRRTNTSECWTGGPALGVFGTPITLATEDSAPRKR